MAIIYDNDSSSSVDVIMANDGHGHLIDIPAIFISNAAGKKLIEAYNNCSGVILKMFFEVFISKIANVTFWLNANNRQSFTTINDFHRDYYHVVQKYMNT